MTETLKLSIARVAAGVASAAISLPRPSGREPYRVLIVPLVPDRIAARVGGRRVAALALVTDPPFHIAPEALRGYFDQTPAEARITAELLAGHTTNEIGVTLGVARDTVRVHVQHVLQKTATSSRPELIAKLAHLPESLVAMRSLFARACRRSFRLSAQRSLNRTALRSSAKGSSQR